MNKIFLYIIISLAVAVAGLFAYNGYKSNQLTERKLELEEKIATKEAEYRDLERAEGEQQGGREQTKQKKQGIKQAFEERTTQTISENVKRQVERLNERLK